MIDFIQNWGALILSLISIIGCVVTYVIHDRKLSKFAEECDAVA